MIKPTYTHAVLTAFAVKALFFHANLVDVCILGLVLSKLSYDAYLSSKVINVDTSKVLDRVTSLEGKIAALGMVSKLSR